MPAGASIDPRRAGPYPGDMSAISVELRAKEGALLQQLQEGGRTIVALSGGVDSGYLAYAAAKALGADSLAVTAVSPSYPRAHRDMVDQLVADYELVHRFIETHEMESGDYRANRPDRCYHCKNELFERLGRLADELHFDTLAYGVNTDDQGDFRPGHRAAVEHRVLAPLLDADMSKADIRALAREAGLPCADLPASACLSSRLPYGTEVTVERLAQVEEGEARLRALGFRQVRLRHHGDLARIEVDPSELSAALSPESARAMVDAIKPLGFRWVSIDLEGYRMGSLNEVLFVSAERSESR
jgi:uncharacterized protein